MTAPQLDKSVAVPVSDGYGTISIRVVVLDAKLSASASPDATENIPADASADEVLPDTDKRPTSSFLEEPKRGKQVCVFLINGQRQHAWDNHFIMRDMELKYLRNRMIVVVDCDGLRPEAIADLMQGSRFQFYEGKVYAALEARVIATLKGDPDLARLEEEAEDQISSLEAGDEVVKATLDQLIEAHHEFGEHSDQGQAQAGSSSRKEGSAGSLVLTQDMVVEDDTGQGTPSTTPVLQIRPDVDTIRIKANAERKVTIIARPETQWSKLKTLSVTFDPPIKELQVTRTPAAEAETISLLFAEGEEFDQDEYPIETTMRVIALFDGHTEPRLIERRVVILPKKDTPTPPPPPPKPLSDDPTFIRVTSRQPIKILLGGPDVHVRLRWDGSDQLLEGADPSWTLRVSCESPSVEPPTFLTKPQAGRFELLVQAAAGLKVGEKLRFDIEAIGPAKSLATSFLAEVVEPLSPRKIAQRYVGGGERRPPYELKYLKQENWSDPSLLCFSGSWNGENPGAYDEPTAKSPLIIFINQDTDLLTTYRDRLLSKKLAEATIQQRVNKYTAHVAFHLYQMYVNQLAARAKNDGSNPPDEDALRAEIQRVAQTLIKLMEVSQ